MVHQYDDIRPILKPSNYQKSKWKSRGLYIPTHPSWGHIDLVSTKKWTALQYLGFFYYFIYSNKVGRSLINLTLPEFKNNVLQTSNWHYHFRWVSNSTGKLLTTRRSGYELTYIVAPPITKGMKKYWNGKTKYFGNGSYWTKSFKYYATNDISWYQALYMSFLHLATAQPNAIAPTFDNHNALYTASSPMIDWSGFESIVPLSSRTYINKLFNPLPDWFTGNNPPRPPQQSGTIPFLQPINTIKNASALLPLLFLLNNKKK